MLTLLAPPRAQAHDNGLYVSSSTAPPTSTPASATPSTRWSRATTNRRRIEAGYRWSPYFAIQVGYHDFGEVPGFGTPCNDDDEVCLPIDIPIEAETTACSLSFVPQFPLGKRFSVFGKVGAIALETEVNDRSTSVDFFDDFEEEDVIWGAGLRLQIFGPIQVFYEYEGVGEDFETQSFGATWQF